MTIKENIRRFKALDREIEKSEATAERARWEQSQRAFEAVSGTAPAMTQRSYADKVGKSAVHIGRLARMWQKWGAVNGRSQLPAFVDAYRMVHTGSDDVETSKEIDRLRKRLPKAKDKRAEFLAEQMTEDPELAKATVEAVLEKKGKPARAVARVVHDRDRERMLKRMQEMKLESAARAVPLPLIMNKMVLKIGDWARELQHFLDEDLGSLPTNRHRDAVADSVRGLRDECNRWLDQLEPTDAEVIQHRPLASRKAPAA